MKLPIVENGRRNIAGIGNLQEVAAEKLASMRMRFYQRGSCIQYSAMPGKYCIYNAVWGRPYLEPFLQVSLPSFLASGNIPYIASRADTTYVLYTEEQDIEFIKAAPSFKRLESLVSVKIIPIFEACGSEAKDLNKYYRVASCTNHCIRNFVDSDTGLVIAVPDCRTGATRCNLAALTGDSTILLPRLSGSSEAKPRRRCLPIEWKNQGLLALGPSLTNRPTPGRRAPRCLPAVIGDPIPVRQWS
jgi:hypothetical protein